MNKTTFQANFKNAAKNIMTQLQKNADGRRFFTKSKPEISSQKNSSFNKKRIHFSVRDQIIFAKRLSMMIKAGVPIAAALAMLKEQATDKKSARVISHLFETVERGRSLSSGMNDCKNIFGEFTVNIINIGEISGTLAQSLQYMADELKKREELKRSVAGALVYPVFIMIATLAITIVLTVYVFPKILPILEGFGGQLPWTTRALIVVSSFMKHWWLLLLVGLAVAAGICLLLLKIKSVKLFVDRSSLRLPIFGRLLQNYFITNFTRTFGLLINSQIGIINALKITGNAIGSSAYQNKFFDLTEAAKRGENVSSLMQKDKLLFPPIAVQMISAGEMTGSLGLTLIYLSAIYEEELNIGIKNLLGAIEPMLMIFMGVLVGFVALSIITPIYGITQNLHP